MERLDQLRRSSLLEFEHLVKDEHPNPPLRALPEHSIPTEGEKDVTQTSLVGRKSSQSSDMMAASPLPITSGIAQRDFATETPGSSLPGSSSQDFASGASSASAQPLPNPVQPSSFSGESSSSSQQIKAGKMTFTVPNFGHNGATEVTYPEEDTLSPTQSRH